MIPDPALPIYGSRSLIVGRESEMFFEVRDLANKGARPIQIDAPQTLQKRVKRGGGIDRVRAAQYPWSAPNG
jgi:hypothetical protein